MDRQTRARTLTHGVRIEGDGEDSAKVVVSLGFEANGDRSLESVLSRAWAALAEAIAENKRAAPHGSSPPASGKDEGPHPSSGCHAWWIG